MQEESKDVNEEQDKGHDSDNEETFATADTPSKQIMTMVKGMDSKWDSALKELRQTVSKTNKDVQQMKQSIKDEVDNEVNSKLKGSIHQRAKEAVALTLDSQTTGKITKSLDEMFKQAETPLEKLQEEGGIEAITSILTRRPKKTEKLSVS